MRQLTFIPVIIMILSLMFTGSQCVMEPDREFIYEDTLVQHDTIKKSVTVRDTVWKKDTVSITKTVHDTIKVQVTATKRDTLRLHDTTTKFDTVYLLNVPLVGVPNLIAAKQQDAGLYTQDIIRIAWCAVEGAIGYRVYYSTAIDSVYKLATGDIHPHTYDTPVQEWLSLCSTGYFYMDTYSIKSTGTYFFKVTAVDGNGKEGRFSNIKPVYFNY